MSDESEIAATILFFVIIISSSVITASIYINSPLELWNTNVEFDADTNVVFFDCVNKIVIEDHPMTPTVKNTYHAEPQFVGEDPQINTVKVNTAGWDDLMFKVVIVTANESYVKESNELLDYIQVSFPMTNITDIEYVEVYLVGQWTKLWGFSIAGFAFMIGLVCAVAIPWATNSWGDNYFYELGIRWRNRHKKKKIPNLDKADSVLKKLRKG